MELENKIRLDALKKAAIVMNTLADCMQDGINKNETKSLAWTISWAVKKIEEVV
jgi:hypothetical protein